MLGGTSMSGGRGTIGGTIIGAFVIGILSDGLVMMGVSSFWQMVIKGVVIIAAVVVDQAQRSCSSESPCSRWRNWPENCVRTRGENWPVAQHSVREIIQREFVKPSQEIRKCDSVPNPALPKGKSRTSRHDRN